MAAFERLPAEVRLRILSFLLEPQGDGEHSAATAALLAADVVPALRTVLWDGTLWRTMAIDSWFPDSAMRHVAWRAVGRVRKIVLREASPAVGPRQFQATSLDSLLRRAKGLQALDFPHGSFLTTDSTLVAVAKSGCQLERVGRSARTRLVRAHVSDQGLFVFAAACAQLRELWIEQPLGRVTDVTAKAIAAHCPLLETLAIKNCTWPTDAGISAIAASCRHLRALHMGGNSLSDASVDAVAARCGGTLETLTFDGCSLFQGIHMTDARIHSLLADCPRLTTLVVGDMSFLGTVVSIRALVHRQCAFRIGAWTVVEDGGTIRADEIIKWF